MESLKKLHFGGSISDRLWTPQILQYRNSEKNNSGSWEKRHQSINLINFRINLSFLIQTAEIYSVIITNFAVYLLYGTFNSSKNIGSPPEKRLVRHCSLRRFHHTVGTGTEYRSITVRVLLPYLVKFLALLEEDGGILQAFHHVASGSLLVYRESTQSHEDCLISFTGLPDLLRKTEYRIFGRIPPCLLY